MIEFRIDRLSGGSPYRQLVHQIADPGIAVSEIGIEELVPEHMAPDADPFDARRIAAVPT